MIHPLVLTFALVALLSGPNVARANGGWDNKLWGGAVCVPYGNTPAADYSVRGDGIQNVTPDKDRWVVCVVPRDSEKSFGPESSAVIEINGTITTAGSIDCMLTKGNASMPPMSNVVRPASLVAGNWTVNYDMADLYSSAWATLTVTCRLPPKALLSRVRYAEKILLAPANAP